MALEAAALCYEQDLPSRLAQAASPETLLHSGTSGQGDGHLEA